MFAGIVLLQLLTAPAYVQNACDVSTMATTTMVVTLPNVQVGSLLVVVATSDGTNNITALTDSQGNTYALGAAADSGAVFMEARYARSSAAGNVTVTATYASAVGVKALYLHEYSGVGELVSQVSATGNSNSADLGVRSTVGINGVVLAAAKALAAVTSGGAGFTGRGTCNGDLTADNVFAAEGMYRPVFSINAAAQWAALALEFGPSPAQLATTTPARQFQVGACGGSANVMTVELRDATGLPVGAPTGGCSFTLSSSSAGGLFFFDSGCTSPSTGGMFTLATGARSVNVFYRDSQAGMPAVTMSNGSGLTNAPSQTHLVVPTQTPNSGMSMGDAGPSDNAGTSDNAGSSADGSLDSIRGQYSVGCSCEGVQQSSLPLILLGLTSFLARRARNG